MNNFTWDDRVVISEKVDGSLILLYRYADCWRINTRGSFADGELNGTGKTWDEWIRPLLPDLEASQCLDPAFTYVLEFVSPFNKVVRLYPNPSLYLLAAVRNRDGFELDQGCLDRIASELGIRRPARFALADAHRIRDYLAANAKADPTFEGFVCVDGNGQRIKFKSETYVQLHHLVDNGNIFSTKRLLAIALSGERDEIIAYVPELEAHLLKLEASLEQAWSHLIDVWHSHKDIVDQKQYALAILGKTPFTSLLFRLRKEHGSTQTIEHLRQLWNTSGDLILKHVFGE